MPRHGLLLASLACALVIPTPTRANTYTVVIDNAASWTQAHAAAVLAGGYLATITSAAEQAAVEAAIAAAAPPPNGGFWINLRETGSECCYVWDTGETTCYSHFFSAEPNNGSPGETRGQLMWSSTPSRNGYWNDVPDLGISGSMDVSRLGYVIETGPLDPAGPCGACVTVSPSSFCNIPPAGATTATTRITGVSTGAGVVMRTIIDISEPPPRPGRLRPARAQSTYMVTLPVVGAGVTASTVAGQLRDSINRQVGAAGFVANYANGTDNALIQMYRVSGNFSSTDNSTVPGIGIGSLSAPMASGFGQAALALILAALAGRASRTRRRSGS